MRGSNFSAGNCVDGDRSRPHRVSKESCANIRRPSGKNSPTSVVGFFVGNLRRDAIHSGLSIQASRAMVSLPGRRLATRKKCRESPRIKIDRARCRKSGKTSEQSICQPCRKIRRCLERSIISGVVEARDLSRVLGVDMTVRSVARGHRRDEQRTKPPSFSACDRESARCSARPRGSHFASAHLAARGPLTSLTKDARDETGRVLEEFPIFLRKRVQLFTLHVDHADDLSLTP